MKKIRIMSIILLMFAVVIFVSFKIYEHAGEDTTAPVITCPDGELVVSVGVTDGELLSNVTAKDNRSGDVSETLEIERISEISENAERIITYAAIDEKGNVGRCERIMKYSDYQSPYFELTAPLRFPIGKRINIEDKIRVNSVLDGDLSKKVKYSLEDNTGSQVLGMYNTNMRVTDSAGSTADLTLPLEIYDPTAEKIQVNLSAYLVYLHVNAEFDPFGYYAGADQDGTLDIQSNVDMSTAGIYYVDYIMYGKTALGKSRLLVIVNE